MKTILLSAGHSDQVPGIVANGWREADLATRFRDSVAAHLRAANVPVLTDGNLGINLSLPEAIRLEARAQIRVEFHFNAPPLAAQWPTVSGIEALAGDSLKQLSQQLCGAIASVTGLPLRGDHGHKQPNAGAHSTLGFCRGGGIIVEGCFLTNKNDLQNWLAHEAQIAQAVASLLIIAAQ